MATIRKIPSGKWRARMAQFERSRSEEFSLRFAREVVRGKLENSVAHAPR